MKISRPRCLVDKGVLDTEDFNLLLLRGDGVRHSADKVLSITTTAPIFSEE